MSNRSLMSTLKLLGRTNVSSVRQGAVCTRQFGTTAPRGVRATFVETENAELNAVLKTIQEKTIFPALLPQKQRKIVFNPKMRIFMQQNPIIIEVDGIEHRFAPIDRTKDIPNSKKTFNQVMELMETPEDWSNLPTLLAGYKKANVQLRSQYLGKLVRRAAETGNIYSIIDCAKQSEKTGFKFQTHEMVTRLLAAINQTIVEGDAEATQKAVKWVDLVLDLLHLPQQNLHKVAKADTKLHRSRPARGLVLYARASDVLAKQDAGEDAGAALVLLKDEIALLKTLWKDADLKDLSSLSEFEALNSLKPQAQRQVNGCTMVQIVAQNIKAMSLARELVGAEAQELQAVEAALSQYLEQYVSSDARRTAGWAEMFESIAGVKPSWAALPSKPAAAKETAEA